MPVAICTGTDHCERGRKSQPQRYQRELHQLPRTPAAGAIAETARGQRITQRVAAQIPGTAARRTERPIRNCECMAGQEQQPMALEPRRPRMGGSTLLAEGILQPGFHPE